MRKFVLLFNILLLFFYSGICQTINADSSLYADFLKAQTRHYNHQADPFGSIIGGIAPFLGTLIGGLIAYYGILTKSRRDLENERGRLKDTQEAEARKAERALERSKTAVAAALMKELAIAAHKMTWILWTAKHDKQGFTDKLMDEYNAEMKKILVHIVGIEIILASYDTELQKKIRNDVEKIFTFDGDIGRVYVQHKQNDSTAIDELANMHTPVYEFLKGLSDKYRSYTKMPLTTTVKPK